MSFNLSSMTVDLAAFPKMDDQTAIKEAASAGLKSMEHLIRILSHQSSNHHRLNQPDCSEIADFTVSKFKKVISILDRTGHARFRRGPSNPPSSFNFWQHESPSYDAVPLPLPEISTPRLPIEHPAELSTVKDLKENINVSPPVSSTTSSFMSSVTGDGSVSNGKLGSSVFVAPAPPVSTGKPPLLSTHRKKCKDHGLSSSLSCKISASSRCHCSKRRKSKVKRSIRVPAISSKVADIPADEYSWRKYGQKPIKGSPFPRGYYRCSSVKDCPAKKHVERCLDDPTMLIVTYGGEHRHPQVTVPEAVTEASMSFVFQQN